MEMVAAQRKMDGDFLKMLPAENVATLAGSMDGTRTYEMLQKIPMYSMVFAMAPQVKPIMEAIEAGLVPVVTPLGTGLDGQVYNINADIAACRIAEAIHARKLVFLSDVPGILADCTDETSVIPTIRTDEMDELIQRKIISGGMLPKLRSCVNALNAGINKVHLIDGRVMHTLLLEIFTDRGVGTQIVRPDSVM